MKRRKGPKKGHPFQTKDVPCGPDVIEERAEGMRYKPTAAEAKLHNALLEVFAPYLTQVVHQYIVGYYIADFKVKNLLIEVDGSSHRGREVQDKTRTTFLESRGYRVLRLSNDSVFSSARKEAEHILHLTQPHQLKTEQPVQITYCPPGSAVHGKDSPAYPKTRIFGWNDKKKR